MKSAIEITIINPFFSDTLNYYLDDSWEYIIDMIFDEHQLNEVSTDVY